MKKLVIVIVVLGVLGLGYAKIRSTRMSLSALQGETTVVKRGDLVRTITATGQIEGLSVHQIKAEASGEVIEILHQPGDTIEAGDLLIRLLPDDEERNVNRARADLESAQANLDRAKILVTQAKTTKLKAAEARMEQFQARLAQAQFNRRKVEGLAEQNRATEDELVRVRSNHDDLTAQLKGAEADLEQARLNVALAEKEVILAEARAKTTRNTLGDAEKQLRKTNIVSPVNGVVSVMRTQIGEVIQGGRTNITGGTLLANVENWDHVYVMTEVDEADIGRVLALAPCAARPGPSRITCETQGLAPAQDSSPKITVEAFRDEEFVGRIERIYPEPNKSSSVVTYLVKVEVVSDNRDKLLKSMRADVEFTAETAHNVVLVPNDAIKRDKSGSLGVYRPAPGADTDRTAEPEFVPVELGLDDGMHSEVRSGLSEGDVVYVKVPEKTDLEKERAEEKRS